MKKKTQASQSLQGSGDVISDLAEDVLNLILVRLPIRDVVRTSILSTKWRYKWCTVPDIVFDDSCLSANRSEIKYAYVVDQVLLHHIGPIRKFSCMYYVLSCTHIDRWIVFLSRNGIKQLILKLYDNYYDVPSSIFFCQDLCHLELFNCRLKVPRSFKGFHNLMVLNLEDILISEDEIARLILNSPILERLTLRDFDFDCLNIHAPNLRYLDLKGAFQDLSLESSPLLSVVSVNLSFPDQDDNLDDVETCNLIKFIGGLHGIEKLVLKGDFLQFLSAGNVPEKLSTTFDHLKCLDVDINLGNSKEIIAVICLLRSSQNLQELKIKCSLYEEDGEFLGEDAEFWCAEAQLASFNHLRVVEIIGIFGMLFDMELIKCILANAPMLQTMKIYINEDADGEEDSRILKGLLRCRRASKQAEVLYLGHCEEE